MNQIQRSSSVPSPDLGSGGLAAPAGDELPIPSGVSAAPRRKFILGLWLLLILIVGCALAGLIPRWKQRTTLKIETGELSLATVTVVNPAPSKALPGLTLPAEVKPLVEAPIHARANGYLKRWLVDLGAQVEAGQVLAEIDTPELNQELAHAKAELSQAQAALDLAKTTAARWADLLKTTSVSQQETQEKQADLALKSANLEAAQANVRRLEELQSFAHVTAPFAGIITARLVDTGDLIMAGSGKELFRLCQTKTLRVFVHVPQTVARAISVGQLAELFVPELPGRVFEAKVVRTSGIVSVDSRTLLTELEVSNPRGEILAGSYAQIRFKEIQVESSLTLPSNSLLFRAEGPQVGIVKDDGTVELRNISLGRDFGQAFEVLEGVSSKDRVIVNPADSLVGGVKVRVASAK